MEVVIFRNKCNVSSKSTEVMHIAQSEIEVGSCLSGPIRFHLVSEELKRTQNNTAKFFLLLRQDLSSTRAVSFVDTKTLLCPAFARL